MTKAHSEIHDNDGNCESCDAPAPQQTTYPVLLADIGWGTMWLCTKCLAERIERDKDKGPPFARYRRDPLAIKMFDRPAMTAAVKSGQLPPSEPAPFSDHCIGCGKPVLKGELVRIWDDGVAHEYCPRDDERGVVRDDARLDKLRKDAER